MPDGCDCPAFRIGVIGPGCQMDVYSYDDDEYIDIRAHLRDHLAELDAAALTVQRLARGRLMRRCLLPTAVLSE